MKLNEVIQHVDLSKRAIKFYEEENLLKVKRDDNGYRDYSNEDIELLKEISVYRKLGIDIRNIKILLIEKDMSILKNVLIQKEQDLENHKKEVEALKAFIDTKNIEPIYEVLNYETIAQAIQDAVPGFYGYYFLNHFLPYLQMKIETPQQEEAYHAILDYWDNVDIHLPIMTKLGSWAMYRFNTKQSMKLMVEKTDATLKMYLNPTADEYEKLKEQVRIGVKIKQNPIYKYSFANLAQRKFMKELQNKGYNDIFIPNMIALSPKYKAYHDALYQMNNRICDDLGLYYDGNFHLKTK